MKASLACQKELRERGAWVTEGTKDDVKLEVRGQGAPRLLVCCATILTAFQDSNIISAEPEELPRGFLKILKRFHCTPLCKTGGDRLTLLISRLKSFNKATAGCASKL